MRCDAMRGVSYSLFLGAAGPKDVLTALSLRDRLAAAVVVTLCSRAECVLQKKLSLIVTIPLRTVV